ncbi:hypothetical protein DXG01_007762, partial [Tephrocybe rancida]
MSHCASYLKFSRVKKEHQMLVVSEFLEGKAWTFYARQVSRHPSEWTLEQFFRALFNECFPMNFRDRQRTKLREFTQGKLTVRSYIAELVELFTIVGSQSKRERIVKMFKGLSYVIRKGLIRIGLTPERSSWNGIIRKAEFIEMAEMEDNDEDKPLSTSKNNNNHKSSFKPNNRGSYNNVQPVAGSSKQPARPRTPPGRRTNNTPGFSSVKGNPRTYTPSKTKPGNSKNKSKDTSDTCTLSKEELEEYRADNRCFGCGETGHFARNCPHGKTAKSTSGKPPGMKSYSVCMKLRETDRLREKALGDTTQGLSIGAISFENAEMVSISSDLTSSESDLTSSDLESMFSELEVRDTDDNISDTSEDSLPALQSVSDSDSEDESDHQEVPTHVVNDAGQELNSNEEQVILGPDQDFGEDTYHALVESSEIRVSLLWELELAQGRPRDLGEATARKLQYMLELHQPYPGDPANVLQYKGTRFFAYQIANGDLCLWDHVRDYEAFIPVTDVACRDFLIGTWYAEICSANSGVPLMHRDDYSSWLSVDPWAWNAERVLSLGSPYSCERWISQEFGPRRFFVTRKNRDMYRIEDKILEFVTHIEAEHLFNPRFDIVSWYERRLSRAYSNLEHDMFPPEDHDDLDPGFLLFGPLLPADAEIQYVDDLVKLWVKNLNRVNIQDKGDRLTVLELNGQQVEAGTYPALLRHNVKRRDPARAVPKPLVIVVKIDGHPVRALVDSGSLGDFMSSTIAEQLKVKKVELSSPVPVQLAVQGSRSKVNYGATAKLEYQQISGPRYFDIMNLNGYNLILGTPWIYQHKVTLGINPPHVVIGSQEPVPMVEGVGVSRLSSRAMEMFENNLELVREDLHEYAKPLCRSAAETPLPPLRDINHEINLIDETMVYPWHPSKCPEALRPQWDEKRAAYVKTGRWEITANGNAVPMMFLKKPGKQ